MEGRRKNKGFSLVEIICAVAIFSLVTVTIGTVIVFTARSYRSGTSETKVQQEAQFAANRIGGIIQNATKVHTEPGSSGNVTAEFIIDDKHTISYDETAKELTYSVADGSQSQLLAENIEKFFVDSSKFDESKTVGLELTVGDGTRSYSFAYTMNSRNDEVTQTSVPAFESSSIIVDSTIVMVPGETYEIPVRVRGTAKRFTAVSSDPNIESVVPLNDGVQVTLKKDAGMDTDEAHFEIRLLNSDGSEVAGGATNITVLIRRVKAVKVTVSSTTEGEDKYYVFRASVEGSNMSKLMGVSDNNWKNPYQVDWNKIAPKLYQNYGEAGESDITAGRLGEFFDFENIVITSDKESQMIKVRQKPGKALEKNMALVVTAVSMHANGENKAGIDYDESDSVKGEGVLRGTGFNVDTLTAVLEPGEEKEYTVTGTGSENWECDIKDKDKLKDPDDIDVQLKNGKLTVKIGDDETGYHTDEAVDGEYDGNIIIEIKPEGSDQVAAKVYVGVRRVTKIAIQDKLLYDGDKHPVSDPLKKGADHQFATTVYGTHLKLSSEEINALAKDSKDRRYGDQPFAVEFSWTITYNGAVVARDNASYPSENGYNSSKVWNVYWQSEAEAKNTIKYESAATDNKKYARLVDFGANNRKYSPSTPDDSEGNNVTKVPNHPCINFSLVDDLPKGAVIKVTAKALYPYTPKAGKATYGDDSVHIASVELGGAGGDDFEVVSLAGFCRGQDQFVFEGSPKELGNVPYDDGIDQNNLRWFMRVREVFYDENGNKSYGAWSAYRKTIENSKDAKKLNATETASFLPDRGYQIEMALMAVKDNKVLWPYNDSVIESGSGFVKGWTNGKTTPKEDYRTVYEIGLPHVSFIDPKNTSPQDQSETLDNYGSVENPIEMHKGDTIGNITLYDKGKVIEMGHFQNALVARLEKQILPEGTWQECSMPSGMNIEDHKLGPVIKYDQNNNIPAGIYRISFKLENSSGWYEWNGSKYESVSGINARLYDGTNGYIYIKIMD